MAIVNVSKVLIDKNLINKSTEVVNVNLNNVPFLNNDASFLFNGCSNLQTVNNLSNIVNKIDGLCAGCAKLTIAPTIPASVKSSAKIETQQTYEAFILNTPIVQEWDPSNSISTIYSLANPTTSLNDLYYKMVYIDPENPDNPYVSIEPLYYMLYGQVNIENVQTNSFVLNYETYNYETDEPEYICYLATRNSSEDYINVYEAPIVTGAFQGCTNLTTTPTLEDGVTNIQSMFKACTNLTVAPSIPNSVINASRAFSRCQNITTIGGLGNVQDMSLMFETDYKINTIPTIPNSVTNIGGAFRGCMQLTDMPHIPSSVVSALGVSGVHGKPRIYWDVNKPIPCKYNTNNYGNATYVWTEMPIPTYPAHYTNDSGGNSTYSGSGAKIENITNNTFTFWTDGNQYKATRNTSRGDNFLVESDTTDYVSNMGAFEYCVNLVNATDFEEGIQIMDRMFTNCSQLVNVIIPNSVTSMVDTFYDCRTLVTAPSIPDSVINLCNTFGECTNLKTVGSLSNSATNMSQTFWACYNLQTVPNKIPDSVTNLYNCFGLCHNLTKAPELSNSAVNISYMFYECNHLTTPPIIPNTVKDMSGTFSYCCNLVVKNYEIPEGVETVSSCFKYLGRNGASQANCEGLTFPSTIKYMNSTFFNTSRVGNIYIKSTEVETAGSCFNNGTGNLNVYIPFTYANGTYTKTYNTFTAAGWSASSRKNSVQLFNYTNL